MNTFLIMRCVTFHSSEKMYSILSADMFPLLTFPSYSPVLLTHYKMLLMDKYQLLKCKDHRSLEQLKILMEICLVWHSYTYKLNCHPILCILAFKALEDLSFGCFSEDISTFYPSLTHFKYIWFSSNISSIFPAQMFDLLFPGSGKLFPLYQQRA